MEEHYMYNRAQRLIDSTDDSTYRRNHDHASDIVVKD